MQSPDISCSIDENYGILNQNFQEKVYPYFKIGKHGDSEKFKEKLKKIICCRYQLLNNSDYDKNQWNNDLDYRYLLYPGCIEVKDV